MKSNAVKILSWNVNGIRAVHKKGFLQWLLKESPDVLCLQEIKALESQLMPELLHLPGYKTYWHPAARLGYSGVAIYTKQEPLAVKKGLGITKFDDEGRLLRADFPAFTLLNIYFPNGQMNADRLRFKLEFYEESLKYFRKLKKEGKRLVICGDYNTAHKPIDLARPDDNAKTSGFLPEERAWIDRLIGEGFIDSFRVFNDSPNHYSWWDLRTRSRERNIGWRIDYHFVCETLKPSLAGAFILPEVTGSDHCPVGILLKVDKTP